MNFTNDMMLASESGYCMPFNGRSEEVRLISKYGEDGNEGVDFAANRYVLKAVADGIVTGIGATRGHGLCQTTRYGDYEVVYGGISNALVGFGRKVKAGSVLAISGQTLHMEVRHGGRLIDPVDFLTMLFGNVKMQAAGAESALPEFETIDMDIPTAYDDHQEEIEELMTRFYPDYLREVASGLYRVPELTEQSLRNVFSLASARSYFYENLPSLSNPLGLGERSIPAAAKVQNLLIADFLNYLALRHKVFLSVLGEESKKKDTTRQ